MKTLALAAAAAVTLCLVGLTSQPCPTTAHSIEAAAYNTMMPVSNGGYTHYHRQVTERLEYLEVLLRDRDVSNWPAALRAERTKNIERLREYRLRGAFPINYDHPDRQLPCFLDRDGNLCAVANLIAKSEGMKLVEEINSRYQYATVSEMTMPELDRWIASSGLTREEVITIQEPGFTGSMGDQGWGIIADGSIETPVPFNVAPLQDTTGTPQKIDTASTQPNGVERALPDISQAPGR